jgi:Fe-S cluster assembly ATP-binding protein
MATLELKNLHVALEDGTEIVKGVDLRIASGEVHAVMGPNGSGKSTLAYAIAGHPAYEITGGQILLDGHDITEAGADERAQAGLFLAFQYPHAIPGVTVTNFLRQAVNAVRKARNEGVDDPMPVPEFRKELLEQMDRLKVSRELASRYLNDGFSGGEKKRVEILQMAILRPKIAVLDETDSGLDIDALKIVASGVNRLVGPDLGALVITHYQRILTYIKPDFVHVFVGGRIVEEGGPELAEKLEASGYEEWEEGREAA